MDIISCSLLNIHPIHTIIMCTKLQLPREEADSVLNTYKRYQWNRNSSLMWIQPTILDNLQRDVFNL